MLHKYDSVTYKGGEMMNLSALLKPTGTITINKTIAHSVGLDSAVVYAELLNKYEISREMGELINGEWFPCSTKYLEENTTIKQKTQQRVIKTLKESGLVEVEMLGLPAKRYFKLVK